MRKKSVIRMLNGYKVVYEPDHPKAMTSRNWHGYVYEHIVVAEKNIRRSLRKNEVVHHLDGDRLNNRYENLLILEKSQHTKLHMYLRYHSATINESDSENRVNSVKAKVNSCMVCGQALRQDQKRFCSPAHAKQFSGRNTPEMEEVLSKLSELNFNFVKTGKFFGVSDNAVRKWCKKYKITKPIPSQARDTSLEGVETSGEVESS